MVWRRAAAAPDDVDEPGADELPQVAARVGGQLVVEAELVRQAGVRVAGDVRPGNAGQALHVRPHLRRAERAVDADDQRIGMLDRDPERLDCLPGQVAPGDVDGGEREPARNLRRDVQRGRDRRLRIQRVEDRLDQQKIDAPLCQRGDLLCVGVADLFEGDGAIGRIVDPRRQ